MLSDEFQEVLMKVYDAAGNLRDAAYQMLDNPDVDDFEKCDHLSEIVSAIELIDGEAERINGEYELAFDATQLAPDAAHGDESEGE